MAALQVDEQVTFEIARQIPCRETRETYLRQVCAGDDALMQRIADLLRAYEENGSFLEAPPPGLDDAPRGLSSDNTVDVHIGEAPGTIIGPYKLLEQIAEGGMGIVYMAQQFVPVERRVALKIIKPGLDTRHVIARFQAEWQALAMMDHPNIAKMLDAGTTASGRPYFVMELVKGVPITEYCDDRRLSPNERLELFILVCQAVQHAHQKGIIHRDLKPSNVLVAQYDDRPVPKIIDFGVAKATGQRLTAKTVFTHFGQIVGTAEYMSPEQAQFNQLDIDTRSDVYSLGVLLYELLSGLTPFDRDRLRSAAFDEMLRIVREEEPPRPSIRISTSEQLPTIAANRQIEPKKLGAVVRGELDWIVMKALEKDRSRRYQSAGSFAVDVRNYLNNEPVQACPPSARYRLRKFARRNRAVLCTTLFVAAALLLGTAVAIWQAIRASRESRAKVEVLAQKDAALATARQAVDQMLVRVGAARLNNVPLAHPLRQELFGDALKFYDAFLQQAADDVTLRQEAADVLNARGVIQRELGQYESALESFAREIDMRRSLVAAHPAAPALRESQAAAEEDLAYTWHVSPPGPNHEQVDGHYREALEIYADLERRWPNRPQPVALVLRHLAELETARGNHLGAERRWRESIERGEKYLAKKPADDNARGQLCWACVDLWESMNASAESRLDEMEQAVQTGLRHSAILLERDAQSASARDVAASLNLRMAMGHCRAGRLDEAAALFEKSVREIESLCADFPWNRQYWITARYFHTEAIRSLEAVGRREDAQALARVMRDWLDESSYRIPGDAQPRMELLQCQTHLAGCLQSLGEDREAALLARAAMQLQSEFEQRSFDAPEDRTAALQARLLLPIELLSDEEAAAAAREKLLPALVELKSDPAAFAAAAHALVERAYRARENWQLPAALALATCVADAAADAPSLAESRIEGLDEVMHNRWRLGQLELAEAAGEQLLAMIGEAPSHHWAETSIYGRLAEMSLAAGRFEEAERWARKSLQAVDVAGSRNTSVSHIHLVLARALQGRGKLADALDAFRQAWAHGDSQSSRDEASLAFYEWMAAARNTGDSKTQRDVAAQVLNDLKSRHGAALDGVHLAWQAMAQVELGAADAAARSWSRAFERGMGDARAYSILALAQVHSGDDEGYRRTCGQLVDQLGSTLDGDSRWRIAWACALGPEAVKDFGLPIDMAAQIVEENPDNAAFLCTLGAVLYRAGRYDEADIQLRQSIDALESDTTDMIASSYPKLLLAMTQWRLDRQSQARALLAELHDQVDDDFKAARVWNRAATLELLHRETQTLIEADAPELESSDAVVARYAPRRTQLPLGPSAPAPKRQTEEAVK